MSEQSEHRGTLPEEAIARFRATALERIERLEDGWAKLASNPTDTTAIAAFEHELHTLKGEARMVGFTDVDLVAHKLEDVVEVCRERDFQITDDVDLVTTMALRFMAMLIRKKAGQTLGGIDLPGFVRQLDSVVHDTRGQHPLRGRTPTALKQDLEVLPAKLRERLAGVAVDLFLEIAAGRDHKRIRRGWQHLRDALAPAEPEPIAPVLARHEAGAHDLARDLGKQVVIELALADDVRAPASIVRALDIATLHLVRNAIDHGIETADARVEASKPPIGTIGVRCAVELGRVILEISDDGQGIDFPAVRQCAIALGLLSEHATPTDAELANLLFHPGLTTRAIATPVSGRGIGLDVVHGQIAAVGGHVEVVSHPGRGTTWTVVVPSPHRRFPVRRFAVRGTAVQLAVTGDWELEVTGASNAIDLVEELGLGPATSNPYTMVLTRGEEPSQEVVRIGVATDPVEDEARWLVSPPADGLAGVVAIDGVECLAIKPEALLATSGRVAIVDDSEIVRELVGFSLRPYGVEVVPLDDPQRLLGTLADQPFHLVLLDLSFKGVDVAALVRQIKQAAPDCAVYLHSDRTPIDLARIAETAGADGYLAKALGREQFVARVLRILRGATRG